MSNRLPAAGSLARRFALSAAALAGAALLLVAVFSSGLVGYQQARALSELQQKEVSFSAAMVRSTLEAIVSRLREVADSSILANALVDSVGKEAYLAPYLQGIQQVNGIPVQILFADFEGNIIASNGAVQFTQTQLSWLRQQLEGSTQTATILPGTSGDELLSVLLLSYSKNNSPDGALFYKVSLSRLDPPGTRKLSWTNAVAPDVQPDERIIVAPVESPPPFRHLGFHVVGPATPHDVPAPLAEYAIIFLIALAVAAAVAVIGSRLAYSLTRDLRRLEAFSSSVMAQGFGTQRADVTGTSEVAGLAKAINHMLDRLYEQHTQLHQESEKLKQLANTIPQLAWMAHPDGWVHWYNDRWYEYTGTTREQMQGWGWQSVLPPDSLPQVLALWKNSIASGRPFEMTFPLRAANGEFHTFFTRAAPLRDASGRTIQWFGTNTDVTPLQQAEQALRVSEERLREGLIAGRMVVWDWDLATDRMSFSDNAAEVFGRPTGEDPSLWEWIHPEDVQKLRAAVDEAIRTRGHWEVTARMIRPDDRRAIWIELRGKVSRDASGRPVWVRGIFLDVTERKRAEEELRAADRRKDEFLAMLAHELRNPLAPISTAARLLKLIHIEEPRVVQMSEIISRQVDHMTGLVDDLLDVSRVTRGLVNLEKEELDLGLVVSGAVEQVRPLVEARRHHLKVEVPGTPVWVRGDRTRLVQVLANLLNNAAKYTPEEGRILVKLEKHPDHAELTVEDDGVGIAPNLLPHIFDLFTQGERSPDRSQGGLGLGLALVKSLVALHGGSIRAESPGIGKGSRFVVRLTRSGAPEKPQQLLQRETAPPREANSLRILVVDDNVDAARSLAMLLEAHGHQVAVEYNAADAVERVRQESPCVLMLDIGLPDIDGYELARRLRQMPETRQAVLIALTGYGREEDRERSKHAGFDHHLVKPVNPVGLCGLLVEIGTRDMKKNVPTF